MKSERRSELVAVRLTRDQKRRLDELARRREVPHAQIVRESIKRTLSESEAVAAR